MCRMQYVGHAGAGGRERAGHSEGQQSHDRDQCISESSQGSTEAKVNRTVLPEYLLHILSVEKHLSSGLSAAWSKVLLMFPKTKACPGFMLYSAL